VYGDYLAERGDPRGELIAVQLAAEQTNDAEIKRAALRVFAKHRDYFIGELGSMIATDAFTWRAGFIHRAVLSQDRMLIEGGERVASSLAEVVGKLLAHPSARFLVDLVIRTNDRSITGRSHSQKEVVEAIAKSRPLVLRRLQLGDAAYGFAHIGKLDHVWPALTPLHELVLEGEFGLGQVVAPQLRTLSMWPTPLRRRVAKELVEAAWPALRSLSINLGNSPDHITREIIALMQRTDMPALRHVGLIAYQNVEAILYELVRSPVLARLETLDLRHAKLSDRAIRQILKNAVAFEHLARIDLSDIAFSTNALEGLQKRLPSIVGT